MGLDRASGAGTLLIYINAAKSKIERQAELNPVIRAGIDAPACEKNSNGPLPLSAIDSRADRRSSTRAR
jgi:hypothetical protein